jgi:F0F1-type ATP synthase assembly protein I
VSSGDVREPQSNDARPQQMVAGLALASVVSQVGCVTIAVVLGALVVGLGLDRFFETRPLFTILFLLGSIPLSLYLLVRIALSAVAHLNPPPVKKAGAEPIAEEDSPESVAAKEE